MFFQEVHDLLPVEVIRPERLQDVLEMLDISATRQRQPDIIAIKLWWCGNETYSKVPRIRVEITRTVPTMDRIPAVPVGALDRRSTAPLAE